MKTKGKKSVTLVLATSLLTSMNMPIAAFADDVDTANQIRHEKQIDDTNTDVKENEELKNQDNDKRQSLDEKEQDKNQSLSEESDKDTNNNQPQGEETKKQDENKESKNKETVLAVQPKAEASTAVEANGVALNDSNFPDANFLAYLKANFDTNKDGSLSESEIQNVTYINVNNKGIKSLEGIDQFTNLEILYANNNYIGTLDLSQNDKLKTVQCNNNMITSIKLPNQSENNTLSSLDVSSNRLTVIDLHQLSALTFLDVENNELTSLDLSQNPLTTSSGFLAQDNYLQQVTLPNNNQEYPWAKNLATQLYPKDKNVGYTIKWYTNSSKTEALDPNKTPTIECTGQTLYSQYVPIEYTIKFNPGLGQGSMQPQEFTYGKSQKLSTNTFTRKNYKFVGWKSDSGKTYTDGQTVQNLTDVDGKVITLTAMWQEIDYTGQQYTINLYDGKKLIQSVPGTYGQSVTLPNNSMTKEGYRFVGWNYGSGDDVLFTKSIRFDHPDDIPGSATDNGKRALNLYAVWQKDEGLLNSTVTINNQSLNKTYDGKPVENPSVEKTGSTNNVEITWYQMVGSKWQEIDSAPTNAGQYKVVASVQSDGKYNEASAEKEFEITKATNTWTEEPSINGWTEGSEANRPSGEAKFGQVEFTYSNSQDGPFTSSIPSKAGKWYMKATVEGNDNYTGLEKIVPFNIEEEVQTATNVTISNGTTNTKLFTYGDKIIVKLTLKSSSDKPVANDKEVALFVNGKQITKAQPAVNDKELVFEYNTRDNLIKPDGSTELYVAYVNGNQMGNMITDLMINLEPKPASSSDIVIPEINQNTDLNKLQIKDGNVVLKKGVDYDITKSQEGDKVTVTINFKGNYTGKVERTYTVKPGEDQSKPEEPVLPDQPSTPGDSGSSDTSKPEQPTVPEKPALPNKPSVPGQSESNGSTSNKPGNEETTKPEKPNHNVNNPQTGDAGILGYMGLGLLSLTGLYKSRKGRKNSK